MSIHTIEVEGTWLTQQDEAQIVLAQIAPPTNDVIEAGLSRPQAVETARELLGDRERLAEIVTGNRPAILIFPEYAFGIDDWPVIDQLVRGWSRPLILIAGCGVTRGKLLNDWLDEPGDTERLPSWLDGAGPANERVYNGGWVWVHRPLKTVCAAFLKTTAEQSKEILIEGLDQGSCILCISLDDLIIFPVICSDMLNCVDGKRVVRHAIASHLEEHLKPKQRVLVVGLLLQDKPHEKWRIAITDLAGAINVKHVNICLVNSAHNSYSWPEAIDRWRDYSGMYIACGRKPHDQQFPAVRRFSDEHVDGAVVRATSPCVLGGPLRWTFDNAAGRQLWVVQKDYSISNQGKLEDSPCKAVFSFESLRVLKRLTEAPDLPGDLRPALVQQSYKTVETQMRSGTEPSGEVICRKLLFGEVGKPSAALSADSLSSFIHETAVGLKALGALKLQPGMEWQANDVVKGHLRHSASNANVLVWFYPYSPISMRQTILLWRSQVHEPLVVFKKATGVSFPHPAAVSDRRQDVGQAPSSEARSIDEPSSGSKVIERPLDEIEECFGETTNDAFTSAISTHLLASIDELSA